MDNNAEKLYEQVYLFFLKKNSNDIVFSYIKKGMNLIFNSNSLVITYKKSSYTVTVITKSKKKYWNLNSNKKDYNLLCREGNLENVLEFIYKL